MESGVLFGLLTAPRILPHFIRGYILLAPLRRQHPVASGFRKSKHERAVFAMYGDAPVARDVAYDVIGRCRFAAFGDPGHQVVYAADGDVCRGGSVSRGSEDFWFCNFYHTRSEERRVGKECRS